MGAVGTAARRKPTTAENKRECSILAVVGGVKGGGSNSSQRKPRTTENKRECSILSIVGAAATCQPPTGSPQPPKMSANTRFWQLWGLVDRGRSWQLSRVGGRPFHQLLAMGVCLL